MDQLGPVAYPNVLLVIRGDYTGFHLVTAVCRAMVKADINRAIVAEAANQITAPGADKEEYLKRARKWITVVVSEEGPPNVGSGNADPARYAEMVSIAFGNPTSVVETAQD